MKQWFKNLFKRNKLKDKDVKWIVNELSELGVEINGQRFFLYKGRSICYSPAELKSRPVFKREFGECCHPRCVDGERLQRGYIGFHGESHKEWSDL